MSVLGGPIRGMPLTPPADWVGDVARPRVLVSIPVRDEAYRLASCVFELQDAFDRSGLNYRIAVAEDGSTDRTPEVLQTLLERVPNLIVQSHAQALGRGKALRLLWNAISAEVYCFTDADLAAGADSMVEVVQRVLSGRDVVVGSRYVNGASLSRPNGRRRVSLAYNQLLRMMFDESIRDHQCGLKAFSATAIHRLLPLSHEDSWFWDTEILVLADRSGVPVLEMPVHWTEKKTRRTPLMRLLSDVYLHGTGALRLRSRLLRRDTLSTSAREGVYDSIESRG